MAKLILPDLVKGCPFPLTDNIHYEDIAPESEVWLHSHGLHPNAAHRKSFQDCDFGRLTSMCYPTAEKQRFRILCDYINCLFAFDDLTDEGGLRKDEDGTRRAADIVMCVLRQPDTYKTEFKVGEVIGE